MRLPDDATVADLRKHIFAGHSYVRHEIYRVLPERVESAIDKLGEAYTSFRRFDNAGFEGDDRKAHVQAFLYTAFNSVVTSTFLLLSGMLVASGNLMRQYGEACALALLCSDPRIDTFLHIKRAPARYPYHTALHRVNKKQNRDRLRLKPEFWTSFMTLAQFYDNYSHAGMMTVASTLMVGEPKLMAFLGEFDPGKVAIYEHELKARYGAANVLAHVTTILETRLPFDRNASASDQAV